MARFHVTIIRPPGYAHSDCFREVAESLFHGLRELGHVVTFAENRIVTDAKTILLGAHLLSWEQAKRLPASAVVYNLEQLGMSYTPEWYMELAARTHIWDFSSRQVALWAGVRCAFPPQQVEIGYVPQLTRVAAASEADIDVLFYGSMTERRRRVLEALKAEGIEVHAVFGVYGAERDALIGRSKIVLNIHAFAAKTFEVVRVSYLLANSKAVVTEESDDMGALSRGVKVCTCESMVAVCKRLLTDERERQELEHLGFQMFSARPQPEILARVVGEV